MKSLARTILPLCLALFAAALGAESRVHLSETLERTTASVVYPVDCDGKAGSVRIEVSARVEDGEIAWTLVDPSGRTRLTGAGNAGKVRGDTGSLEPVVGRWELRVGLNRFTGNYRIDGSAR